jgi:hypothetical protein
VGASSYPVELDELYGDSMVFKVNKIVPLGSSLCQSFEVLDVFQHPSLLDIFLRPCCSHRASNVGDFFLYVCLSGYLHLLILLLCLLLCSVFYVLVFCFVFSLLKSMLILLIILLLIASLMIPRCLLGLMMLSSWGTITWVPSQRGQGLLSFFSFFVF